MNNETDDNDFTKILTTTPPSRARAGLSRTTSWLSKARNEEQLVTCPSCRGTGVKEDTNELVAMIPYSDERLQPRRTMLKVTIALTITAAVIGILFFVFYPRHAEAVSLNLVVSSANINYWNESKSVLVLTDDVMIKNNNYFPITIETLNITIAISWDDRGVYNEVGTIAADNIQIPAHISNMTRVYDIKTTSYPAERLFRTCCYVFAGHFIWYRVSLNVRYKLMFFGNFFSSTDTRMLAAECDYPTNSNITCEYDS